MGTCGLRPARNPRKEQSLGPYVKQPKIHDLWLTMQPCFTEFGVQTTFPTAQSNFLKSSNGSKTGASGRTIGYSAKTPESGIADRSTPSFSPCSRAGLAQPLRL